MYRVNYLPIVPKEPWVGVSIEGYEIKNPTTFEQGDIKESQLHLKLTFYGNDYSPRKYVVFMNDFIEFLSEKGYTNYKKSD